ncbi:MAG: hypothetical protein ACI9VM_000322 [Candidatus Azotimanducaceae bacterium]
MSLLKTYNFINGLSSEIVILLLALGVGYTFDSLINALISYYLILLGKFLVQIISAPEFWKINVPASIGLKKNFLRMHYFIYSVTLAGGVVMIPDEYMEITAKIAWYFGAVVLYRLVMQTLLLLGFDKDQTAHYLNSFVVFSVLLPFVVYAFVIYRGFVTYQV